jgi:hypothetical protein
MAATAVISDHFVYYFTNDAADPVTFTLTRGLKIVAVRVFATNAADVVTLKDAVGGNTIASITTAANAWVDGTITTANAILAVGDVPELDPVAATTTQVIIECIAQSGEAVTLTV